MATPGGVESTVNNVVVAELVFPAESTAEMRTLMVVVSTLGTVQDCGEVGAALILVQVTPSVE